MWLSENLDWVAAAASFCGSLWGSLCHQLIDFLQASGFHVHGTRLPVVTACFSNNIDFFYVYTDDCCAKKGFANPKWYLLSLTATYLKRTPGIGNVPQFSFANERSYRSLAVWLALAKWKGNNPCALAGKDLKQFHYLDTSPMQMP